MLVPTIIMVVVAVVLLLVGYYRGEGQHVAGLKSALKTTIETLPMLLFAFVVAGMMNALIPKELVSRWVGEESGIQGILIGAAAGGLTPGGPYVFLPIAAVLLRSGASLGTTVAFLVGKSLWSVSSLPMEVGIMGWKFTLMRLASTFFFPFIAGLIAQGLFALVH